MKPFAGEPSVYEEQQPWQAAADQPGGPGGEHQAGGEAGEEGEEGEELQDWGQRGETREECEEREERGSFLVLNNLYYNQMFPCFGGLTYNE